MKTRLWISGFIAVLIAGCLNVTAAEPTKIVVRAQAQGAKFVGSSMGGALVLIRNHQTGQLLAKGYTQGSTGDTQLLMKTPHERGMELSRGGVARFEVTLNIDEPVLVDVSATGPVAQPQSSVTSSTQVWLIPGRDMTGDGIILKLPGFSVDVVKPQAHSFVEQEAVDIQANVVMMCGCPVSDGGLWDSSGYTIKAMVKRGDRLVKEIPLKFSGQTSTFIGRFTPSEAGAYRLIVYAYDPRTGNTGVDESTIVVSD